MFVSLTLLHSERPKLHRVLAVLRAIGLNKFKNRFDNFQCTDYEYRETMMP